MKFTSARYSRINLLILTALILSSQRSGADTCSDTLTNTIASFSSQCTGQAECYGNHPEGYGVPTGKFVPIAPVAKISGTILTLSCNATANCAPYTYPNTPVTSVDVSLCTSLPYVESSIALPSPLHGNNALACGSIVGVDDQTLGESIPLKGSKFNLNYFSHFNPGRGNYTISLPLTGSTSATDTDSFTIKVSASDGVYAEVTLPNQANLTYTFIWDGKNKSDQLIYGQQGFKIEWTQHFLSDPTVITVSDTAVLGGFNALALGIGGWVPSIYRFYNPVSQQLFEGSGNVKNIQATEVTDITGIKYMIGEPDRSLIHYFDINGRLMYSTLGTTGTTVFTYNYDTEGRLTSIDEPFSLQTIFSRTTTGVLYNIVAPRGSFTPPAGITPGTYETNTTEVGSLVTRVSFNTNGYLSKIRTLDGTLGGTNNPSYEMTYDNRGLLLSFKNLSGSTNLFTYDIAGHLIKDQKPNGYFFELVKTINSPSYTVTKFDVSGNSTAFEMNVGYGSNLTRTTTTLDGIQDSIIYTDYGVIYNSSGFTQSVQYDSDQRVAGPLYPSSESASFGTTSLSRNTARTVSYTAGTTSPSAITSITTTSDFGSSHNISTYTASNKTYRSYHQRPGTTAGPYTDIIVDTYERPISLKRGSLTATTITYDQDLISSIIRGSNSTYFKYNSLGQLTGIGETSTTNKVTFSYNDQGRLASELYPSGHTVNYLYDGNGNITSLQINPINQTHLFTFNAIDAISSWATPLNRTTSYVYNLNQTVSKITKPSGQEINYTYSLANNLTKITTTDGDYNITYNSNTGIMSAISTPTGYSTEFTTEGPILKSVSTNDSSLNEISTFTINRDTSTGLISSETVSIGTNQSTISYTFDLDLRKTQAGDMTIQYDANDLISGTTIGSITETYTRNADGLITARIVKYGTTTKYSETLTLNNKNKITAATQVQAQSASNLAYNYTDSFTYDDDERISYSLRTDTIGSYPYGLSYFYTTIAGALGNNQLLRINSADGSRSTFTYNNDDELTNFQTVQGRNTLRNVNYTYTQDGQLSAKTETLYRTASTTNSYVYDGFGNLKQVTLNNGDIISYEIDGLGRRIGKKLNGTVQRRWVYQDQYRIAAEIDSSGSISKRFVYATNRHVPDYMIIGSEKYKLISDRLGSIKLILKVSDGSIAWEAGYSDLGNPGITGDSNLIPFGFAGGLWDADTQLVHFGAREYDPIPGRWTTKDPIGFNGGDTNLYGYGVNDPINRIDPTGLYSCTYSISSHSMSCTANDMNNPSYSSGSFVSGNGANANNPAATDILNSGPLPVGSYSVGAMNPGSKRRNLTPLPGTDLGNRTGGFQTHGCSNPSTCSNGCIAATTNGDRDLLNYIFGLEEGNNTINVVP